MRVTCKINSGKLLPDQLLKIGYSCNSEFSVSIGVTYETFAMSLWRAVICVLLSNNHGLPSWFPIEIFDVSDSTLPTNWLFFSSPGNHEGLQALWGYERIIVDESHYDALLERDPDALRIFYDEREIISRLD